MMFVRQLRNELWKLFGKQRTYIGFVMFLIAQNAMLIIFRVTRWQSDLSRMLEGNGYFATEYISALTAAVIMLIPQIVLLMPLYTSLIGGDLVAKEVEDGTLRMILCRPVSRLRLMLVKWLAGVAFSAVLVLALGAMALFFARLWFPWKGLFVFVPHFVFNVLSPSEGWPLYALSQVFLVVNAVVILSIAFMFSCFNMKPAAATILALSYLFLNLVLEAIPFFDRYEQWFLPYHFRSWLMVFARPTPWARIAESQCILIAVAVTAFIIGAAVFQVRDIKS
jgi:ABC-2 type transport system permease protein